ncbi:MAG: (2Fe-2S)-binding protein [Clostridia bacterium]|nr:(2Fe-2S)-binding protein [Clostridia bacterium]
MEYAANELICKCKKVTYVDIERALHSHKKLKDVEAEFEEVQKLTQCSTGCGGCQDKIMGIISKIISG